jgi:hypothetical protein
VKKVTPEQSIRIPVKLVDGTWEFAYGGKVPVGDGTEGELIVPEKAIADAKFLERMRTKANIRILDEGTELLAYVVTKDDKRIPEKLKSLLIPWNKICKSIATEFIDNWSVGQPSFAKVTIGSPTDRHKAKFETRTGGLWLLIEGRASVGLQSSRISLSAGITDEAAISLNHAFTLLSEVFEPWRKAHTGNVYQRYLYQEKNGHWYPLELLRNGAIAGQEQAIAYGLWQDFLAKIAASKNI